MRNRAPTFDRLLAPTTIAEFVDRYFGVKPLVVSRPAQEGTDLLSSDDIERLLFAVQAPEKRHWFILIKDGISHPAVRPIVDERGDLAPTEAIKLYYDGYTIVLNQVHKQIDRIGHLCRDIEAVLTSTAPAVLRGNVTANLYLTPAGTSGFAPHYDNHDVVVVQLSGSKNWQIYAPTIEAPVQRLAERLDRGALGAPTRDICLRAGDVLYLPRGVPHEASTSCEHSTHLTLGIRTYTWSDVLARIGLLSDAARQSMTVAAADVCTGVEDLTPTLSALIQRDVVADALQTFGADRRSERFPAPSDRLDQINRLAELTLDTELELRDLDAPQLILDGERLKLHCVGNVVELPRYVEEAVRQIIAARNLTVRSIGGLPTDSQRLIVARHLVGTGVVRMTDGD